MPASTPTWFITGCSTGIGRELALAVLARGWNVVATARNLDSIKDLSATHPDNTLLLTLDVTDEAQIAKAVTKAGDHFGGVDVLVNNAGYGYRAAVEEGDEAEVATLFATNVFGPIALIKAVLPGMRERRAGGIVNLSSVAGVLAAPGSGYYSASKFALEGISDALRKEAGPLGITVMVVEPGPFRTDFSGRSLQQATAAIPDYAATAGARRKENDTTDGTQPGDPVRAAQAIIAALEASEPPFRLVLGNVGLDGIRAELQGRLAELDTWEKISRDADFPA